MSFYERIYGCSIDEYCKHHGITKDELIEKKKKDIELLEKSYKRYSSRNEKLSDEELFIAMEIKDYLDRKKQSLRRIG